MLHEATGDRHIDLRAVVEHAPLPIYAFDLDGMVYLWNRESEREFGWRAEEVLGRPIPVIPDERADEFVELRARMLAAETLAPFETVRMRKDNSRLEVIIHPRLLLDREGEPWALLAIVKDISERKAFERETLRAEEQLRESEARYRMLVERFPGFLWTVDREFHLTLFEGGGLAARAMAADELLGRTVYENGGDPQVIHAIEEALRGRHSTVRNLEYRGSRYDTHLEPLRGPTGEVEGAIGVTIDVTEVQEAREEIHTSREELQRLSSRILQVQEEQRARISRELHDDLGQKLTALKYDVAHLQRTTSSSEVVTDQLRRMSALLDETLQAVRDIARELRPAILDHFGAGAAMEYELREFEQRTGIRCSLMVDPQDANPPGDYATALYRMLQEALTNVARHSRASAVEVVLRATDGQVEWTFRDNGIGLPPAGQRRDGLGLASIRERAASLGGTLHTTTPAGGGTLLRVTLPLERANSAQRDR